MRCAIKLVLRACDEGTASRERMIGSRGDQGNREWMDLEMATDENNKTHPRTISRILPEWLPGSCLQQIDTVDDVSLSVVELLQRSPTFRFLSIIYFVCIHIALFILFLRKSCVCFKQGSQDRTRTASRFLKALKDNGKSEFDSGYTLGFPQTTNFPSESRSSSISRCEILDTQGSNSM